FALLTQTQAQIYLDSTATVEARVNDLLSRMTLQEKIGQMMQVERQYVTSKKTDITAYGMGSLLSGGGSAPTPNTPKSWADMYDDFQSYALKSRLKIPLLYGIDAVHGHNNVVGATIFPHNIGMGCTRDEALVRRADSVVALEVAATGMNWTFAPCIAVPRDLRWGRTYEGFGETPELAVMMARASVTGFQGTDSTIHILACAKHYLADGGTTNGVNEANAVMTEAQLRSIHLPGYIEAVKRGVGSIMPSYSSWNGTKMHANTYLLTTVLKGELGFNGFLISDYAAIDQLSGNFRDNVKTSINAGLDMIMLPDRYQLFDTTLTNLAFTGEVPLSRIDDAVARILRQKFKLGLFEHPYANRTDLANVGSTSHRSVARECVRKSLVLLMKKDGILPLAKTGQKILVAGKSGNDLGMQCGGWTISWQGSAGAITTGTTVTAALQQAAGSANVVYDRTASVTNGYDAAIVVIGETPYAESGGDRTSLALAQEDIEVVQKVKAAGLKTIVVLISGRPMVLTPILPFTDAIIAAWLPGTEGGGIADVLFGDYQPQGLLSHSWPRSNAQLAMNIGDANYDPLFAYGYGITSLANSSAGSAPIYYASRLAPDGQSLIVSFTKAIGATGTSASNFTVRAGATIATVSSTTIDPTDTKNIILSLTTAIASGDSVRLQYAGTGVTSTDGGVLQSFGPVDVYNPGTQALVIPGTIEAENYTSMSGVQTETTTDVGGGANVGWIDAGDWMEYKVNVTQPVNMGEFRIASLSTAGRIAFSCDGTVLTTFDLPVTGGWQTWQSVRSAMMIPSGQHTIRITAVTGGFNVNWIRFLIVNGVEASSVPEEFGLRQNYPNPFNPSTTISFSLPAKSFVTLSVFDVEGRDVATLVSGEMNAGRYTRQWSAEGVPSGMYFYRLRAGAYTETKKLLLIR
ncbi:MAG TPA: glycoside hydrolase family 3 N-terminal domain-containing protein, partial [Bacteroidota bacterium]|nr:glycoside hydrolase family 3 N-terminal domain-containing protein [Bacteroidota bacterium]